MPIAIHHPHDSLFKEAFGNKAVMQDLLQSKLPTPLAAKIQWPTLQQAPTNLLGKNLTQKYADLLYSAQLKTQEKIYLYFLVEQQLRQDKHMPLRLLEVMVNIARHHTKQGHPKLPTLIPMVLYNGKAPYKGPTRLIDAYEDPDMFKKTFETHFLIPLQQESIPQLLQEKKAALAQILLRQGDDLNFVRFVANHLATLEKLLNESPYFYSAVLYMLKREKSNPKEIIEKLGRLDTQRKQAIMSGLDQLIQEGRQEGRQEGMEVSKMEIVRKMLQDNTPLEQVAKWTGIHPEQLAQLRS